MLFLNPLIAFLCKKTFAKSVRRFLFQWWVDTRGNQAVFRVGRAWRVEVRHSVWPLRHPHHYTGRHLLQHQEEGECPSITTLLLHLNWSGDASVWLVNVFVCFRLIGWRRRWSKQTSRCRRCTETCHRRSEKLSWRSSDPDPGCIPFLPTPSSPMTFFLNNESQSHQTFIRVVRFL